MGTKRSRRESSLHTQEDQQRRRHGFKSCPHKLNQHLLDGEDDDIDGEVKLVAENNVDCCKRKLLFVEILQSLEAALGAVGERDVDDSSSTSSQKSNILQGNLSNLISRRSSTHSAAQEQSASNYDSLQFCQE
ncbi:hypothetical protein GOP47_0005645 [Adiantum capillus-veneris]|uniref:Uncharacterized protein n=1 Tax=Adiantum capillus-veneris TaxID=13818 RepID=A0A9D4V6F3_ADICA|nr:hypothetical protein GOP47_0005645 [Adiantum capillus-veneris]